MHYRIIFSKQFSIPVTVLIGIICYLVLSYLSQIVLGNVLIILVTLLGSYQLLTDTINKLKKGRFALDYIALLAIVVSLYTGQLLVAAILALMISSGRTLEEYAVSQAKESLTTLISRIPNEVLLWEKTHPGPKLKIGQVQIGDQIFIRKGEVIPLDGILVSESGQTDESSLTGEPYFIDKITGDLLRSGTVNIGPAIVIKVTKTEENSTYSKIIDLVKKAQEEQSPFVRLAERYSTFFTLITLGIAIFAFLSSHFDLTRVLSVLAIATPCPLIIATPVALLGGVNAAAKKRIIIKNLSSLESLAKTQTLIFDKTGTITLGKPKLTEIKLLGNLNKAQILGIAESLERNSLHPLAKAIVARARKENAPIQRAKNVHEQLGHGISGTVLGEVFTLSKVDSDDGMRVELRSGKRKLAILQFEDELKSDFLQYFSKLKDLRLDLKIFTGDKNQSAQKIANQIHLAVDVRAQMSPEDKLNGVRQLQNSGKIVAMVGDGINDAPALALADVGLVFSNEEQTSASEAADIVFLGGDFSQIFLSLQIANQTLRIAKQSIIFGIGLSIFGMMFASVGFIPPLWGAGLQEIIDVAVIINALRASI